MMVWMVGALAPWINTNRVTCDVNRRRICINFGLKILHPTLEVKDLALEVVDVLLGWLRKWWIDPLVIAAVSFIEIRLSVMLVCSTRILGRVKK